MNFRTLEYFIEAAATGSISEAAKRLYVAQPSITRSLQKMEEELGVRLMDRSSTGITLTEAGMQLLPQAKEAMGLYRGWSELGTGAKLERVDVYTHTSLPDFILPQIVLDFRKSYPDIPVNFTAAVSAEGCISRSIKAPSIVMTLCGSRGQEEFLTTLQGCDPVLLMTGEYKCLVRADSPLANKKEVTVDDLKDYYLILPNMGSDLELQHDPGSITEKVLKAGLHKVEVESVSNVISLVEKDPDSCALSFFPAARRYAGVRDGRLAALPIAGVPAEMRLLMFYSEEAFSRYPAYAGLVNAVISAADDFMQGKTKDEARNYRNAKELRSGMI